MKHPLIFIAAIIVSCVGIGCQRPRIQEKPQIDEKISVEPRRFIDGNTATTTGQLISPDGEWLLSVRQTERAPLVHNSQLYLEFINLHDKPNKLMYLDWVSPAEDHAWKMYPLGWSSDGKTVYVSYFPKLRDVSEDSSRYFFPDFWGSTGMIFRLDLDSDPDSALFYGGRTKIDPYRNEYPSGTDGWIMDFTPETGIGLWYEKSYVQKGKKQLFVFSATSSTYRIPVFSIPTTESREITSATFDSKDVAYVVHRPGLNDEVYFTDLVQSQTRKIELSKLSKERIREADIKYPYRIRVLKSNYIRGTDVWMVVADRFGAQVVLAETDPFWCVMDDLKKELKEHCH